MILLDPAQDPETPRFRSGVAARMAKMPPSTLRIWERRYNVVDPPRSNAGQRLYSRRDVQRLITLKALSDRGHAIGVIARLSLEQLDAIARETPLPSAARGLPDAIVAIGPGWTKPRAQADDGTRLWFPYPTLTAAKTAPLKRPVDVLLVRLASLHPEAARDVLKIAERCAANRSVVVYAFGSQQSLDLLHLAGVQVVREVGRAADVETVLADAARARTGAARDSAQPSRNAPRFTEAQLATAARASSVIACECPRHLADLIAQISAFEDYSDSCASRNANDALLHRYLGDVANVARGMFEAALERLADVEGLPLRAEAMAS